MPTPLPASRMSSSVFSAWTLAACSPRSTGMEPTASKKDFITRPLAPPVVKYSALAKNATGRGIRAWTITLSRKERWFGATMKGPSLGTFSRPITVGRQVEEMSPRVVQRIASNIANGVHLIQGFGPRAFGESGDRSVERQGSVHDLDGAGRVQFAVGRKTPAYADAVESVRSRPGHVLCPVPHHHGILGVPAVPGGEVGQRRSHNGSLPGRRTGRCRLVGGRAADGVEQGGDAVVLQDSAGDAFGLLGGDGDGLSCLDQGFQQRPDPRIKPALGDAGGQVVPAVDADGVVELFGRDPCDVPQRMAELRPDHGVQPVPARYRQAEFGEGRRDPVRDPPGRIDKSAVEVKDHGHGCMGHRSSFSRPRGWQKIACPVGNRSGKIPAVRARHQPRMSARNAAVWLSLDFATCSGVPDATIRPPPEPPSGPRSTIQSALLMTSRLCSIVITVLPFSTSPCSTISSLRMSSKCRPVVGSSRT